MADANWVGGNGGVKVGTREGEGEGGAARDWGRGGKPRHNSGRNGTKEPTDVNLTFRSNKFSNWI